MRWLHITLVALALVPTVAAADWTERQDTVWQDGDTIHARGRGKTEADAEKRARSALATALGSSLPDLDPELAARSAVIGDRITHGEWLHVRLDFHAANGKACRTARAWRDLGMKARDEGAETRAVAALAHAAWNDPHDLYALDALGLQLAQLGFWGSAAMLYDAAVASVEEPPLSMMRSRVTVHLWMGDKAGATQAVAALRDFDPIDAELQMLESMVFSMRGGRLQLVEQEVMPIFVQTHDAELAVRFAVWSLMDTNTQQALVQRDFAPGDVDDTVTLGGIRFKELRGDLLAENQLAVEDASNALWRVTVTPGPSDTSCLALASHFEPPEDLPRERLLVGGLFPIRDPDGGARLDEGWLLPTYYMDEDTGVERVHMVLFLRWADRTATITLDGPIGTERQGRPGMLTCPELVQMLVAGAYPHKGESP